MKDDWQPGDLAMCVKTAGKPVPARLRAKGIRGCRIGSLYIVEAVVLRGRGLVIDGHHSGHPTKAWASEGFRKIRPHTADAEDTETIRLLTGKPVKEPVRQRIETGEAG